MKEVKNHNGKHWQVRCPECDAWHYVRVLVLAELTIAPGQRVYRKWVEEALIVCARCSESIMFLFEPFEQKTIFEMAHATG